MARVQLRKAAKAYPAQGIEKGDSYYFAQIKTGPRSSRTIRSKHPIPRSQLTTSSFKSQLYDIEDNGFEGIESADDLREVAERVRDLGEEARESFENMPEGLQQGQTGELLEERANAMEDWASEIESAADDLETALEDFDRTVEEAKAFVDNDLAQYNEALADFESLSDEEQANAEEPIEPDEPELPEGLTIDDVQDEDRVNAARQEIIDEAISAAQEANPGVE